MLGLFSTPRAWGDGWWTQTAEQDSSIMSPLTTSLGRYLHFTCVFTAVISPSHAGSMNCPAHKAALAHRCVGAAGRKASQKPKAWAQRPRQGGPEGRVGKDLLRRAPIRGGRLAAIFQGSRFALDSARPPPLPPLVRPPPFLAH